MRIRDHWYVFDTESGKAVWRTRHEITARAISVAYTLRSFGTAFYDYGRPGREIVTSRGPVGTYCFFI